MRKRLLFFLCIVLLVGCSMNEDDKNKKKDGEKEMTTNQNIEEENIELHTEVELDNIDVTNYQFLIPTYFKQKDDVGLQQDFENMKSDLLNKLPVITPMNKSVTFILYASNSYPETEEITLTFYMINHSGKDIESMDFSFKIMIDGKEFPEASVTYKITPELMGDFPNETIMPMYLTIPHVDTSNLEFTNPPHIDMQRIDGTELTNLVVRYKK